MTQRKTIYIGISACLTGEPVRYDGGHTHIAELCDYLSSMFILAPVCPELAIGMGVPRAPIRLVGESTTARALGVHSPALDVTDRLTAFAEQTMQGKPALDGLVVKARSPSCGLDTTPVFNNRNEQIDTGSGIFTRTLQITYPAIPLIDESCAGDRVSLDQFAVQACLHAAFRRQVLEGEDKPAALCKFRQKLTTIAGMKITPRIILPTRLPESINPEEFIKQYMKCLREHLSGKESWFNPEMQADCLDGEHFNAKRLVELLDIFV